MKRCAMILGCLLLLIGGTVWAAPVALHAPAAVSAPVPAATPAPSPLLPTEPGVSPPLPAWLAAGSIPGGVPSFNPCCPIGINCTTFCHGPGHAVCDDGACICICN